MRVFSDQFFQKHQKCFLVLLVFLGLLAYTNALPNQMFWDDEDNILNNVYVQDWHYFGKYFSENLIAGSGFLSNLWRPMVLFSHSLEWHLWQNWAPGYHFINICLHLVNAILVFLILKQWLKKPFLAWGVATFFLIHPIQTEAVTYVSGRGDVLSAFFVLSCLFFYSETKFILLFLKRRLFYLLALTSYFLALLTKETTIVLPLYLLLGEIFVWRERNKLPRSKLTRYSDVTSEEFVSLSHSSVQQAGRYSASRNKDKTLHYLTVSFGLLPFFLLSVIYLFLRVTVLNFQNTFNFYNKATFYTSHLWVRIFTFFKALTLYIGLLFWPMNLHMERILEIPTNFFQTPVAGGFTMLTLMIGIALLSWRRQPKYSLAIFWFLVGFIPTSGILVPINSLIYEHWLYLPMIGFCLFWGLIASNLIHKFPRLKSAIVALIIGFAVFCLIQTIRRNADWRNPITFYQNIIQYNQKSFKAWNNLGMAYAKVGDVKKAFWAYQKAIDLDPKQESAVPYHNLANLYQSLGQNEEAIKNYEKALSIDEKFMFSYFNLVNLYLEQKKPSEAIKVLRKAAQVFPDNKKIQQMLLWLEKKNIQP